MKKIDKPNLKVSQFETIVIHDNVLKRNKIFMGRVCANCGRERDTYGGKQCSKGHFVCHSCCDRHIHCPLCGHTLR